MSRKFPAVLSVLLAAAAALVTAPAAVAQSVAIQPGVAITTETGQCTASFVYDGTGSQAGNVYVGTAAHCVESVGQDVATEGVVFGDVAHIGDADDAARDYAFIKVRSAYESQVNAAVKGHPAMPAGVADPADTNTGDLIRFSGHGLGFGLTPITREQRVGVLSDDTWSTYYVLGPVLWGDSGGPLMHDSSKGAYGIVSRLCVGNVCWVEGPTVSGTIRQAGENGFTVRLRTV